MLIILITGRIPKLSENWNYTLHIYIICHCDMYCPKVFIRLLNFFTKKTHLYWASVILGLNGKPFTERPVRILKDRVHILVI